MATAGIRTIKMQVSYRYFAIPVRSTRKRNWLLGDMELARGWFLYFTCIRGQGRAIQFGCIGAVARPHSRPRVNGAMLATKTLTNVS
jgi:hypothetical protein